VIKVTSQKLNSAVFWVVAPCNLVEVYRRFRGACCLHHQGDDSVKKMSHRPDDGGMSETSVNFYQITRRNNSEGSHLYTRRRENLKSHKSENNVAS
jgi:hypothetical protein